MSVAKPQGTQFLVLEVQHFQKRWERIGCHRERAKGKGG